MQVDKELSFLDYFVTQSIERGAQPYIPENERSGMLNISTFRSQDQHEVSTHGLRFEAYELPKAPVPTRVAPTVSTTELVPVPEPSYSRETHQAAAASSVSDAGSSELKLRLDGVQKKWGRPTYSSSTPSTSNSTPQKTVNGVSQDGGSAVNSKARDSYDSKKKSQVEINPEKQKLAASLFGGSSKTERKLSSANHKVAKASSHATESSQVPNTAVVTTEVVTAGTNHQPPPDLLDLGEPSATSSAPFIDPFKQLEGLLDPTLVSSTTNHGAGGSSKAPDIMSLYADMPTSGQNSSTGNSLSTDGVNAILTSGFSNATMTDQGGVTVVQSSQLSKGPSPKDSLEKDALVRQLGVNPTSQNPNLFKDLLG